VVSILGHKYDVRMMELFQHYQITQSCTHIDYSAQNLLRTFNLGTQHWIPSSGLSVGRMDDTDGTDARIPKYFTLFKIKTKTKFKA
jgi:hypothetical protein